MQPTRGAAWCVFLSLLGIGLSGFLFTLHLGLMRGELLNVPGCSAVGALNCHAVTAGSWGSFLGVPLALWGLAGYIVVFALSLLGWQSADWAAHALTLIAFLALIFVLIDVVLLGLMVFIIRFYCLFCLLTYAVNLALLMVARRSLRRPWSAMRRHLGPALSALIPAGQRPVAALFWGVVFMGVLGGAGVHAATMFVSRGAFGGNRAQIRDFLAKQPRVSVDTSGDPTLGPPGAPIRVVEFSDFLCPACQRASKLNTIIFASHRRDASLTFKHYPLDTSCNEKVSRMVHPGACQAAAASECVHQQGKFWSFHDLVFERGHDYQVARLEEDVSRLGVDLTPFRACMESGQGLGAVKRDIAEGAKIGVTSTPTYVINGVPVAGGLSPSAFEDFIAVLQETSH